MKYESYYMTVLVYFSEEGQSIIRTIDVILFQVPDSLEHKFWNWPKIFPKFLLEKILPIQNKDRGKQ